MRALLKLNKGLRYIEEFILGYGVLVMAAMLIGNSLSRTVFGNSWRFAEEVGQMLMVIVCFVGISYAARIARHIVMSAIFDLSPHGVKKLFLYVSSLLTGFVMLYLAYLSAEYVLTVYQSARITPALRIPMWTFYSFVPLGFFFTAVQYLLILLLNITDQKELYLGSEKKASDRDEDVVATL
jgi:C4-dicarboxylate transporter DctQ subunit